MLNIQSLEQPLSAASPRELELLSPEYEVLSHHLSRAHYAEAATVAGALWSDGVKDVRILGHFLFGVFIERGLAGLPVVFDLIEVALQGSWPYLAPSDRRERHADTALRWLFGQIVHHIEHHKRNRDALWETWQSPAHKDPNDAAYRRGQALAVLLQARLPGGRCVQALYHLQSLLHQLHMESAISSGFKVSAEAELQAQEEARQRAMQPEDDAAEGDPAEGDSSASPRSGASSPSFPSSMSSSNSSMSSSNASMSSSDSSMSSSSQSISSSSSSIPSSNSSMSSSESSMPSSDSSMPSSESSMPSAVRARPSSDGGTPASALALATVGPTSEAVSAPMLAPLPSYPSDATLSSGLTLSSQSLPGLPPLPPLPLKPPPQAGSAAADPPPPAATAPPRGGSALSPAIEAGPELYALLRKLALLDSLCEKGRFGVAALVLSDVQAQLRAFDPLRYFPTLFSGYLRSLVTHGAALLQAQQAAPGPESDLRLTALRLALHSDVELFARLAQDLR